MWRTVWLSQSTVKNRLSKSVLWNISGVEFVVFYIFTSRHAVCIKYSLWEEILKNEGIWSFFVCAKNNFVRSRVGNLVARTTEPPHFTGQQHAQPMKDKCVMVRPALHSNQHALFGMLWSKSLSLKSKTFIFFARRSWRIELDRENSGRSWILVCWYKFSFTCISVNEPRWALLINFTLRELSQFPAT